MSDRPSWQQLVCYTSQQSHEQIETAMENAGALSITWQDAKDTPVLEPLPGEQPLWNDLIITALFESDANLQALSEQLDHHQKDWSIYKYYIETVEDQDWERVWMKDYHPMQFGDHLWIYPSNFDLPDLGDPEFDPDDVIIKLDPGLAFGTGTHPTTALCLEWLDQHPPDGLNLVDYGCGSGILAVAAVKLGAKHVIATDIDPQGLIATKDNMQRNQIAQSAIDCYLPDECPEQAVDLVLANILCGPLIELFPVLSSLTRDGGTLVLSGILEAQKEQLIETYSKEFNNFETKVLDGWVRVCATKFK